MKRLVSLVLTLALALSLTACGGKTEQAPAATEKAPATSTEKAPAATEKAPEMEPVTFKVTYSENETSLFHTIMKKGFDEITAKTEGRVNFELYPSNQLGSITDTLEQMRAGAPMICSMGFDNLGDIVSEFAPASFPYTFTSCYEPMALGKSQWMADLQDDLAAANIYALGYGSSGYRHFISTFEINSAADCAGHIMRMGPSSAAQGFITAMGGTPTTSTWADNYSLLQTGVIDSCEAALSLLLSSSLNEVCPYLALSGHFVTPFVLVTNVDMAEKISADDMVIVKEILEASATELVDEVMANEENFIQQFKDLGVTVTEPDKASFAAVVPDLYEMLDLDPAIYDDIRAAIDANM